MNHKEYVFLERAIQCLMNLTHLDLIDFDKAQGKAEYFKADSIISEWRDDNPHHRFNHDPAYESAIR
tara:strand:- start:279 stop:479 length:201 start_codon:yes stop_codon:yes gene_type:complete